MLVVALVTLWEEILAETKFRDTAKLKNKTRQKSPPLSCTFVYKSFFPQL